MSVTHGPRSKRFDWRFDEKSQKVFIKNERGLQHSYTLQEIQSILNTLHSNFRSDYFPLANNVEWLGNGTEKMGLGRAILDLEGSNVTHAQGSSYLGVILEECGYLEWNGKSVGIEWRLKDQNFQLDAIKARLTADRS